MAKFSFVSTAENTLRRWASLLSGGLSFSDNFDGYEWDGSIAAGTERAISHTLKRAPTRFIVTNASGTNQIVRSSTRRPNENFIYLQNIDAVDFEGKILILP